MVADLAASAAVAASAFEFLEHEYGFRLVERRLDREGFRLDYVGQVTGVRVVYALRDTLRVRLCRLRDGAWPPSPGEIGPHTPIDWVDLAELEAAGGSSRAARWTVPDEVATSECAASLRAVGAPVLRGDFRLLDAAAETIRRRAREYAVLKWGREEAARRWGADEA